MKLLGHLFELSVLELDPITAITLVRQMVLKADAVRTLHAVPSRPPRSKNSTAPAVEDKKAGLTGKVLPGNQYIVLGKRIGLGGFGHVYRARDVQTGAQLAVKVVDRPKDQGHHLLLNDEIRIHIKVSNDPAIPALHRVVEDTSFVYLVMDYCEPPTLCRLIELWKPRMRQIECFEAKRDVFLQIIDVLDRCHKMSVFHRDIKPENILAGGKSGSSAVFLLDFGLSVDTVVSRNVRTGTREYMSPECFCEFTTGARRVPFYSVPNEVWSLGALLFCLMLGKRLWDKPSFQDPRFAEYITRPETYFLLKFGVSQEAQNLLSRALHYNPEKRPTLAEFRRDLIAMPRFFVPSEEAAARVVHLAVRHGPSFADYQMALDRYKRFFLVRCNNPPQVLLPPAPVPVIVLPKSSGKDQLPKDRRSGTHAFDLKARLLSSRPDGPKATESSLLGTELDPGRPPTLVPPSPRFIGTLPSQPSFDSWILQTPDSPERVMEVEASNGVAGPSSAALLAKRMAEFLPSDNAPAEVEGVAFAMDTMTGGALDLQLQGPEARVSGPAMAGVERNIAPSRSLFGFDVARKPVALTGVKGLDIPHQRSARSPKRLYYGLRGLVGTRR